MPCRGMPLILHAEDGGSWFPGIARVGAGPEKLLVVPIPVLRNGRRRQGKASEMKAHPGAALFHIPPEGSPLQRVLWSALQKKHYLILGQKLVVQFGPIRGGDRKSVV